MARNGHTQLTRFKPWKFKLKIPPPRVGENFSLPLSFCPRLSRAGFAFMEFSIYFRWRLRAKCCSKLWGWPASNRNTLLKLHTAPCVSLVKKKKKKNLPSIFIISLVLVPILPPLFQRLLCTKAHSLSLSLFPSLPLCLRFLPLLTIRVFAENRTGFPSTVCTKRFDQTTVTFLSTVSIPRNHDSAVNLPLRGSTPFCQLDNLDKA